MTILREFYSNFTKVRRTPFILLHLLLPAAVTALFLVYYAFAGFRIIPDVRLFFVILQICCPIFISFAVTIFIHLERNISNMQNTLGLVESRCSIYLGKLFFLLFHSAISIIICELCFYIGAVLVLDIHIIHFGFCLSIFFIFLFSSLFLFFLHLPIAFRFGSSTSVLAGISGTILAGLFENPIGDKIWPLVPWEWGVRFLKHYFGLSSAPIYPGIIFLIIITLVVLVLSILWFNIWEGNIVQE